MPIKNLSQNTRNTRQEPKSKEEQATQRINRSKLKKELRILVECLGFGHGKFKEFPEYNILNSSMLKARIYEIIEKL